MFLYQTQKVQSLPRLTDIEVIKQVYFLCALSLLIWFPKAELFFLFHSLPLGLGCICLCSSGAWRGLMISLCSSCLARSAQTLGQCVCVNSRAVAQTTRLNAPISNQAWPHTGAHMLLCAYHQFRDAMLSAIAGGFEVVGQKQKSLTNGLLSRVFYRPAVLTVG